MKGENVFSYIMVLVSAAFFIGSFLIIPIDELTVSSSGGYATIISLVCLILAFIIAFGKRSVSSETHKSIFEPVIIVFAAMLILYVVGIFLIHYVLATLVFLFASIFYLKKNNWKLAVLISYISTFLILLIFKYLFSVIMP